MTRWRGRWLVAVLIAVLAVIGCGVGIAGEVTDEKQLIISSPSDDVILYIGEGNEVISSSASLHFRAEFDDYKTPIDTLRVRIPEKIFSRMLPLLILTHPTIHFGEQI